MIEDQAKHLLNENEKGTMMYYLGEYQRDMIDIDALVQALFELFSTHAKVRNETRIAFEKDNCDAV